MAERLHSRANRRSHFLVPGNWARLRRRPLPESQRIVKRSTTTPLGKEAARPAESVVGFMKWMRHVLDAVEQQKRKRQNKELAEFAVDKAVKKIRK